MVLRITTRALATALLACSILQPAAIALAGPMEDVAAAMDKWSATYGSASGGEAMLPLYAPDATFFGTAFRQPFVGAQSFVPYFATQFDAYPTRKVTFHDPVIRIYGNGAFATSIGTYEFNVKTKAGQTVTNLLRFSFAYVKNGNDWLIVQQHSSQLP